MICPICGRSQLTEQPHVHVSPKLHRDPPTRPQPWLDPDPLTVEPEPVDPRLPVHEPQQPAPLPWVGVGCGLFAGIWLLALVLLLATTLDATPQGEDRPTVPPAVSQVGLLPGAPHVVTLAPVHRESEHVRPDGAPHSEPAAALTEPLSGYGGQPVQSTPAYFLDLARGVVPRAGRPALQTREAQGGGTQLRLQRLWVRPSLLDANSAATSPVGGANDGAQALPPASAFVPSASGAIGTARYSAIAAWCAPTPTHCQSWGGDAKLAAVSGFTFGDDPYWVRVSRDGRHVDVRVVSYCACSGIDLSPSAFAELAPLSRGRIHVIVETIPEGPDDAAMRLEVRGDELYTLPPTDEEETR